MSYAGCSALLAAAAGDISVLTVVSGVSVLLIGNFCLDLWRTHIRKRRLKAALLVDCLETLNKLGSAAFEYHRTGTEDLHDWDCIRLQPRGFIFCSPQIEAKELIALVNEREARLIVRFYERWETFVGFETLYASVHAQLVEILAACCTKGEEAKELRHMKEECWDQLKGAVEDLKTTAAELCGISVALFRQFTWPSEEKLGRLSERRWTKWSEIEAEAEHYPPFH